CLSDQGRLSLPTFAPGRVPDGATGPGTPLAAAKAGAALLLSWGASCNVGGSDYAVYEGTIGAFASTAPALCTTGGAPLAQVTPSAGSTFYLIVPRSSE